MATLLVPDTNVFVQFHNFDGLPWREIAGCQEVVVLVLAAVVRELDKLKLEPRLRDRVRNVLPRLEALFADADEAVLSDGTPARFEHGRGLQDVMQRHGLELMLGDDRILAAILKLQEDGADVAVVTDDAAMRLRARGLGLPVCPIPEKYRRVGADPLQAENAKLRRELDELRTAMPRLEVQFAEGGTRLTMARGRPPSKTRDRFRDAFELRPLSLDSLPVIYQFEREKPTQAEVTAYNERLEEFRPTYEKYRAERDAFELFPHRSFALELLLRNSGGRPAEAVQLSLGLPENASVVEQDDVPTEPAVPIGPKLPGRRRGIHALTEQIESLSAFSLQSLVLEPLPRSDWLAEPLPSVTGPVLSAGELQFEVHVLSNFDEVALPQCLICFPTPDDVRSFNLPFRLRSHSLPRLVEGELHVIIEPAAPGGTGDDVDDAS